MTIPPPPAGMGEPGKAPAVQAMFSRIVARYDLLNDLMTLGLHRRWRRWVIGAAQPAGARALDLGTGTGDLALALAAAGARRVVGLDFVAGMLRVARRKTPPAAATTVTWLVGDALHLPFAAASFDCVTSGFMVRNVADPLAALREMHRVLRPGGRMVCLETTRPTGPGGRLLLHLFATVAPLLGRLVAGDAAAYRYLPSSTAAFADADELVGLIRSAGFAAVTYHRHGFGLAAIHVAVRA